VRTIGQQGRRDQDLLRLRRGDRLLLVGLVEDGQPENRHRDQRYDENGENAEFQNHDLP
jgi:hypothetical protein